MPPTRRGMPRLTASETYGIVVECRYLIEESIAARDAIKDTNKHRIKKSLKAVSDKLPAVLGLFYNIKTQWLGAFLSANVWITHGDEFFACHDACKDLQEVLLDAYTRLDLEDGVGVPKRLGRDLRERGERAKGFLKQILEIMQRLVLPRIFTDVHLLHDIEDALVYRSPTANSGEEVSDLILDCIDFVDDAIEDYNAVQEKSNVPYWLTVLTNKLPSVLRVFEGMHTKWQNQEFDDRVWIEAGPDVISCHTACKELRRSLGHAYPRVPRGNASSSIHLYQGTLEWDIGMAERHLVEIWQCLKALLQRRTIFTDAALLQDIEDHAEPLFQKWTFVDPREKEEMFGNL